MEYLGIILLNKLKLIGKYIGDGILDADELNDLLAVDKTLIVVNFNWEHLKRNNIRIVVGFQRFITDLHEHKLIEF